jgi:hypothetical protein
MNFMKPMSDGQAVARRLRALQQAAGNGEPIPHQDMALHAGCELGAWQMYQSGAREFPFENAVRLKERFGVTLDWIYANDARHNPPALQAKLDQALRNPVPPRRGKRGPRR